MRAISILLGYLMDTIIGDPQGAPHPVRTIGKLIDWCDRIFNKGTDGRRRFGGIITLIIVWAMTVMGVVTVYSLPILIVGLLHYQGIIYNGRLWALAIFVVTDAIVFYYSIALKDLKKEALDVYAALEEDDTENARYRLSMIVGRDTAKLEKEEIIKATIETVAENSSDGVIAPMLFFAVFGGLGVWIYKATSTMDSMIGYKNERYRYFGTAAARMDDVFNYIPSRITSIVLLLLGPAATAIVSLNKRIKNKCFSGNVIKWIDAIKVYFKFNKCSPSPNSAHPEAAMAGVLGIRLGGPAIYKGILHNKPYIGESINIIDNYHIKISCMVLTIVSNMLLIVCLIALICYSLRGINIM